jgi:hypothetical protein
MMKGAVTNSYVALVTSSGGRSLKVWTGYCPGHRTYPTETSSPEEEERGRYGEGGMKCDKVLLLLVDLAVNCEYRLLSIAGGICIRSETKPIWNRLRSISQGRQMSL